MDFRNTKGITLVSLVIYVVIMLMLIAIIAVFKNNIDKNIDSMGEYTSLIPQINKVHMHMLGEVNIKDNKVLKRNSSGSYIEFSSGNSYMFSDGSLYKNSVKVLSDIIGGSFQVETENNNEVLYVNLSLDDKLQNKELKYVIKHLDGLDVDNIAPINVTIASSNIEETSFTLTATGTDKESKIAKYEFYINDILEKTVITAEEIAEYSVIGKIGGEVYLCKIRVYDNVGNYTDSNEIKVTTKKRLYLYNNGDECMAQTGGWDIFNGLLYGNVSFQRLTDSFLIQSWTKKSTFSYIGVKTNNIIDFGEYDKIKVLIKLPTFQNSGGGLSAKFGISSASYNEISNVGGKILYAPNWINDYVANMDKRLTEKTEITIDISDNNVENYFTFFVHSGGIDDPVTMYIYEVWLEK